MRNPGRTDVRLDEVGIELDARPELVLEDGRQRWSAQRARISGTLSWLPFALDYLAECYIRPANCPRRRRC